MRRASKIRVDDFCTESHVSTRTYYKIMRYETVKNECYGRLLIGLCRVATDKQFDKHWKMLGENLFKVYSEE